MADNTAGHKVILDRIVPTNAQIDSLYELLNARQHNISHRQLPEYAQHRAFVEAHPYRAWYLVRDGQAAIGSLYVGQDNAIGINIVQEIATATLGALLDRLTATIDPLPPIASVRAGSFFINVPTSNQPLMRQLRELGFHAVQTSFVQPRTPSEESG